MMRTEQCSEISSEMVSIVPAAYMTMNQCLRSSRAHLGRLNVRLIHRWAELWGSIQRIKDE